MTRLLKNEETKISLMAVRLTCVPLATSTPTQPRDDVYSVYVTLNWALCNTIHISLDQDE